MPDSEESILSTLKRLGRRIPVLVALRAAMRPAPTPPPSGREVIANYIATLPAGADLKVVFGGHWSDNPGWLLLNEREQDVTRPLDFATGTVDVVFAEHVLEHVPFVGAVHFLQEAFRVLKPNGVCRIICPMLDQLLTADLSDANGREYVRNSLSRFFVDEDALLSSTLGLNGINEDPVAFMFNNLYMSHGHQFIWTSSLMIKVMTSIGFRTAYRCAPGEGARPADSIERRRRGLYLGHDWREELATPRTPYDVESAVVEGVK
jgi:SAM-dependent methyltransferase